MSSEKNIKRVLDLLTTAPKFKVESLSTDRQAHTKSLRKNVEQKNIVALGIAEKITDGKGTGKLALTYYVQKKIDPKKLTGDQIIPPTVPESLSGKQAIPTDVVVIGKIVPEVYATRKPIQPGNSIGHIGITAGTLGALVVDSRKRIHILSNSHVLAKSGKGKKGDHIVYPGIADGGITASDVVATLHKFMPFIPGGGFDNTMDCALATPLESRVKFLLADIKLLGLPKGTIAPKRGMKIVKVGRTTGKTTGEIKDVNFRFTVEYDEVGELGFTDQVLCTRYSDGGDSGSLVLDNKSGKAVGLHFAGASGGSVFTPIDQVLKALGVTLVTKPLIQKIAKKAAVKKVVKKTAKKKLKKKN